MIPGSRGAEVRVLRMSSMEDMEKIVHIQV